MENVIVTYFTFTLLLILLSHKANTRMPVASSLMVLAIFKAATVCKLFPPIN